MHPGNTTNVNAFAERYLRHTYAYPRLGCRGLAARDIRRTLDGKFQPATRAKGHHRSCNFVGTRQSGKHFRKQRPCGPRQRRRAASGKKCHARKPLMRAFLQLNGALYGVVFPLYGVVPPLVHHRAARRSPNASPLFGQNPRTRRPRYGRRGHEDACRRRGWFVVCVCPPD